MVATIVSSQFMLAVWSKTVHYTLNFNELLLLFGYGARHHELCIVTIRNH